MMLYRTLFASRFLIAVPVVGCVLLTIGIVVMGLGRIVTAGVGLLETGDFSADSAKTMSLAAIEIIDLFLMGTVTYITAVGLYKLFISNTEVRFFKRLRIETLNDLENKIIGVIVAALGVAFLGHAAADEARELLNYGGGIALVIAALSFYVRQTANATAGNDQG